MTLFLLLVYLSGVLTVFTLLNFIILLMRPWEISQVPKTIAVTVPIAILWPLIIPLAIFRFYIYDTEISKKL